MRRIPAADAQARVACSIRGRDRLRAAAGPDEWTPRLRVVRIRAREGVQGRDSELGEASCGRGRLRVFRVRDVSRTDVTVP